MPFPDLSSLTLCSHEALNENAPSGVYCLDKFEDLANCKSSIIIVRKEPLSTAEATDEPFTVKATHELDLFMSNEASMFPGHANRRRTSTTITRRSNVANASLPFRGSFHDWISLYILNLDNQWFLIGQY